MSVLVGPRAPAGGAGQHPAPPAQAPVTVRLEAVHITAKLRLFQEQLDIDNIVQILQAVSGLTVSKSRGNCEIVNAATSIKTIVTKTGVVTMWGRRNEYAAQAVLQPYIRELHKAGVCGENVLSFEVDNRMFSANYAIKTDGWWPRFKTNLTAEHTLHPLSISSKESEFFTGISVKLHPPLVEKDATVRVQKTGNCQILCSSSKEAKQAVNYLYTLMIDPDAPPAPDSDSEDVSDS